ncbi:efflux RND transporter periplasmic adaptor subunit [Aquabacter sp. CN5-332]|uniref:efflux RND transporter periplasmic adaptor subunit n=1 Tax=Aquabacter sp. CN5-332 TaxID=3156608 RepID=UPI0032B50273
MRRLFWVLILALGVAGGLAWHFDMLAPYGLPAGTAEAKPAKRGAAAIPVVTAQAQTEDVPIYATGIGAVKAFNTVTVTARVDGELQKVSFTEGQDVKEGDVLAQIDPRPYQAALAQAQAAKAKDQALLANAKADLERFKTLVAKNAASQQSLDTQTALVAQYEAAVQGDQATIDNAQVQLGYTTIRAPISGRTGVRLTDEGNIIRATDTGGIVVITQLKPISVVFALPQDRFDATMAAMKRGAVVARAFKPDGVTLLGEGKVALIDNQISSDTGTIKLKATFPNTDLKLWPGAFVNVKVLEDTLKNVVTVPSQAVQRGPDGMYVYVIGSDNVAQKKAVTLGPVDPDRSVVTAGLSAGEQVVVDGQYKLTPGAHVSIVPGGQKAAPDSTKVAGDDKRA